MHILIVIEIQNEKDIKYVTRHYQVNHIKNHFDLKIELVRKQAFSRHLFQYISLSFYTNGKTELSSNHNLFGLTRFLPFYPFLLFSRIFIFFYISVSLAAVQLKGEQLQYFYVYFVFLFFEDYNRNSTLYNLVSLHCA